MKLVKAQRNSMMSDFCTEQEKNGMDDESLVG
jgi:hypothetical protein